MTKLNSTLRRLTIAILACIALSVPAYARKHHHGKPDGTQIVLRPADSYTNIVVNSDVDVEIVVNPKYAGYIVYHTSDDKSPQLQCIYSDNTLIINSSASNSAIVSRVQIVCDGNLANIVNNSSGRVIIPKVKNNLNSPLTLCNNASGDIGIKEYKLDAISIVNNGSGRIGIKKAKVESITAVQNGSGKIYIGGKANSASICNNGSGILVTRRARIGDIDATITGSGNIECSYKHQLRAVITGSGKLYYKGNKPGKNISVGGKDNASAQVIATDFKDKKKHKK